MNIRNCRDCGMYRYIEDNGYCRNCLSRRYQFVDEDITKDVGDTTDIDRETVESWFSEPDIPEGYEIERQYWTQIPYSFVSIVRNIATDEFQYIVSEPDMSQQENRILDEAKQELDLDLIFNRIESEKVKIEELDMRLSDIADRHNIKMSNENIHKFKYYLERDYSGYGRINPLIFDSHVEDISCTGAGDNVFVFHSNYKDIITDILFDASSLESFVQELADICDEELSVSNPILDSTFPDGNRIQATFGTVSPDIDSTFTIRMFEPVPFTPVDLIKKRTFEAEQLAYLWIAMEYNKSMLFTGGTATGKTTAMNAVCMFIPPKAKVATVEDYKEIALCQKNWIRVSDDILDGTNDVNKIEQLLQGLKQRPQYLGLDEIRGSEAEVLLGAKDKGASMFSTIHADSVDDAIRRLKSEPIDIPVGAIDNLDIVCSLEKREVEDGNGHQEEIRINSEIREYLQKNGKLEDRTVSQWDESSDSFVNSMKNSDVLKRIASENKWSQDYVEREIRQRKEVLEYMVEENIRDIELVARVIQAYMIDKDWTLEQIRGDDIDRQEIRSMTYASFD